MEKEWLIRTKNNHILGPVTKEKIKQLISNGSIKGEDEVCSGNGYWIYVKEQKLVAKYVFGDISQSFNPVQEMEPILASMNSHQQVSENDKGEEKKLIEGEVALPDNTDLEYPDMGEPEESIESQTDTTLISVSIDQVGELKEVEKVKLQPKVENKVKREKIIPKKKVQKVASNENEVVEEMDFTVPEEKPLKKSKKKNKNSLYLLLLILLVLIVSVFFFRRSFVKSIIELTEFSIIEQTHAQEIQVNKKKSGYTFQN